MSKQAVKSKEMLSKQADKIAKQAEEHERFINKVPPFASCIQIDFVFSNFVLCFSFSFCYV